MASERRNRLIDFVCNGPFTTDKDVKNGMGYSKDTKTAIYVDPLAIYSSHTLPSFQFSKKKTNYKKAEAWGPKGAQ